MIVVVFDSLLRFFVLAAVVYNDIADTRTCILYPAWGLNQKFLFILCLISSVLVVL